MGLFSRNSKKVGTVPQTVDASLPDGEWLGASRALYEERVRDFYGSPETMAAGGEEHYGLADFGTAMFFYAKSIDMLHTAYGFSQMADRRPSPADLPIIDGYTAALGASLDLHADAPVEDCVREVTHRLRSISSECDRVGVPSALYRSGLEAIATAAPGVPVDDVLWT